jgi:hypothetical protein
MEMRLKAFVIAAAILWAATMFVVGLLNLWFVAYGGEFLRVMSSLYPGYHATRTFAEVLFGTLYGLVDGAIAGYIFGLLYRWAGGGRPQAAGISGQPIESGAVPFRRAS